MYTLQINWYIDVQMHILCLVPVYVCVLAHVCVWVSEWVRGGVFNSLSTSLGKSCFIVCSYMKDLGSAWGEIGEHIGKCWNAESQCNNSSRRVISYLLVSIHSMLSLATFQIKSGQFYSCNVSQQHTFHKTVKTGHFCDFIKLPQKPWTGCKKRTFGHPT